MALDPAIKVPLLRCFHEKSYDRWVPAAIGRPERKMGELLLPAVARRATAAVRYSLHSIAPAAAQELEDDGVRQRRVHSPDGELPSGHRWVSVGHISSWRIRN